MPTLRRSIATLEEGFRMLRRRWFPLPMNLSEGFLESIADWMRMNSELRDRTELHQLTWQLYSEASDGRAADLTSSETRAAVAEFVKELRTVGDWMGLMETAFYAAELDQHNAHPINRGWNVAYRRWAEDPTFRRYWPVLRGEFSRRMVEFCEQELNLGIEIRLEPAASPTGPTRLAAELQWLNTAYGMEFRSTPDPGGAANVRYASIDDVLARAGESSWIIHWNPLDKELDGTKARLRTACGVIALLPPRQSANELGGETHELFVWIHGCHRNLQIGRAAFASVVESRKLFDLVNPRNGHVIHNISESTSCPFQELRVYLPRTQKEELRSRDLRAMWYAFFTPYGFRKVPRAESRSPFALDDFEILRYSPRSDSKPD